MRRTLEMIFRHPLGIFVLLVVLPVVGFGIAYEGPRSYQSQANLFALGPYVVIGSQGAQIDQYATWAQTQSTALQELLQTRAFDLQIASKTSLAQTLPAPSRVDAQTENDAIFTEISTHVQTAPVGSYVYSITYANKDPNVAQQVVQAVIDTFKAQTIQFSNVEGQQALDTYTSELATAQLAYNKAAAAEQSYIASHPGLVTGPLASDPQYLSLHNQSLQAQSDLNSIQLAINALKRDLIQATNGNGLFSVQDAPSLPIRPVSRTKTLLIGAGGGVAVALLACALYLAMLLRRDRSIYSSGDLPRVTSVPVIMELPVLSAGTAALSVRLLPAGEPMAYKKGRR